MLESDLTAKNQISFKSEKVVHVTLVQGLMLFPQLTITYKTFSHITQSGTEYRGSKAIPIQARRGP